jgi:hypothetical protein
MFLVLLLAGVMDPSGICLPNTDFSGTWKQSNERSTPSRTGNVILQIDHRDPDITVETTILHGSAASRHALQHYTPDGKTSVSTGVDKDEFRTSVVWSGQSLVFSVEEHEMAESFFPERHIRGKVISVRGCVRRRHFAPDTSLGQAYFLADSTANTGSGIFDSIIAFSTQTFMPAGVLTLPVETFEGAPGFTSVDVVRWGQDGLAVLSSGGNIYLVRGAAIVPQLLQRNPAASLTA